MSFTLVLNSQNVFGTGNNTYKYNFVQGNFIIPPDSEVMVANVQIPYSFCNITSAYDNNSFIHSFQFIFSTSSSHPHSLLQLLLFLMGFLLLQA